MKICSRCKILKSLDEFPSDKRKTTGKSSWCKLCSNKASRDWIHKNKEKCLLVTRQWRDKNRKKYSEYQSKYQSSHLEKRRNALKISRANDSENNKKESARMMVRKAINKGTIIRPTLCGKCGKHSKKIFAHHPNYDEPLLVEWVCPRCHGIIHNGSAILKALCEQWEVKV